MHEWCPACGGKISVGTGAEASAGEKSRSRATGLSVSTVLGVAQVRSKTIRGGSEISIVFNPGTDMRRAEQLTWNRLGAARSSLPVAVAGLAVTATRRACDTNLRARRRASC